MLTIAQRLSLYALGVCCKQLYNKYRPLEVPMSKITFIEILLESGIGKTERGIYKNLKALENSRLIFYQQKELHFTPKGYRLFTKLDKEVNLFIKYKSLVENIKLKRKLQSHLSHNYLQQKLSVNFIKPASSDQNISQ